MKMPGRGEHRIAAGAWPVLMLVALARAPAAEPAAPSWAPEGPAPQDTIQRHTYPNPRLAPLEPTLPPHGGILVQTRGCLECHRLGDRGARNGVDLSTVGRRLNAAAIERLLLDPHGVNTEATMLRAPLTRAEVLSIAEFLSRFR